MPSQRIARHVWWVALTGVVAVSGCWRDSAAGTSRVLPPAGPDLRVLLRRACDPSSTVFGVDGAYRVTDARGAELSRSEAGAAAVRLECGPDGVSWCGSPAAERLVVKPARDGALLLDGRRYRGEFTLVAAGDGRVSVINGLALEHYLAGVLRGEIPRRFQPASHDAIAIAARTYALFQLGALGDEADYHVLAGERSQVYVGVAGEDSAVLDALMRTCGVVLTAECEGQKRVFEAFYCSTCGGVTASASAFTGRPAVAPLRGGVICEFAAAGGSPFLRWPAVRLSRTELWTRLLNAYPSLAPLDGLARIEVAQRSSSDQPTLLRLVGTTGSERTLRPEELRTAVGERKLRSAWFDVSEDTDGFVFSNGRGYGHGVGLCQYGAEGMARAGRSAAEILRHYYPQSELVRAY